MPLTLRCKELSTLPHEDLQENRSIPHARRPSGQADTKCMNNHVILVMQLDVNVVTTF